MATYCFICPQCSYTLERGRHDTYDPDPCPACGSGTLRRDYRAEQVGIGSGVRESKRELTTSGYRDLFLPTADDMRTPDDPSGQKGLREWAETHGPKESNKKPVYPEMERKTFAVS